MDTRIQAYLRGAALGNRVLRPRVLQQREYQTVSIPSDHPANYSFWLNVSTSESGSIAYDYLYAEVRSTSATLLATLATYTKVGAAPPGVYSPRSFSLASWRGQRGRRYGQLTPTIFVGQSAIEATKIAAR